MGMRSTNTRETVEAVFVREAIECFDCYTLYSNRFFNFQSRLPEAGAILNAIAMPKLETRPSSHVP